jgi:hypothetical protein
MRIPHQYKIPAITTRICINYSELTVVTMALYMLYRTKSKSATDMDDLRMKFQDVYKKHNVDIVGFWVNAEDDNEVFYMSKYKDEDDYRKKVEELRSDEAYTRLTRDLQEIRQEFESTRLLPKWVA